LTPAAVISAHALAREPFTSKLFCGLANFGLGPVNRLPEVRPRNGPVEYEAAAPEEAASDLIRLDRYERPAWSRQKRAWQAVRVLSAARTGSFIVRDGDGQALAYVYIEGVGAARGQAPHPDGALPMQRRAEDCVTVQSIGLILSEIRESTNVAREASFDEAEAQH
jgi:hypothetical protein